MNNKTQAGQSLMDKAIEMTGDIDNSFALALANGISVTDDLQPGTVLKSSGIVAAAIAALFAGAAYVLATAYAPKPAEVLPEGIGFWAVGIDFKVN
ncbi:MAG: hypothetical protein KKC03_06105 [Bacteroidetes bacterium]|nr:hypothetical protein [Bacteroidota bacterium]